MRKIYNIYTWGSDFVQVKTQKEIGKNTYFETWYMKDKDLFNKFGRFETYESLFGSYLVLNENELINFKKIK